MKTKIIATGCSIFLATAIVGEDITAIVGREAEEKEHRKPFHTVEDHGRFFNNNVGRDNYVVHADSSGTASAVSGDLPIKQ